MGKGGGWGSGREVGWVGEGRGWGRDWVWVSGGAGEGRTVLHIRPGGLLLLKSVTLTEVNFH